MHLWVCEHLCVRVWIPFLASFLPNKFACSERKHLLYSRRTRQAHQPTNSAFALRCFFILGEHRDCTGVQEHDAATGGTISPRTESNFGREPGSCNITVPHVVTAAIIKSIILNYVSQIDEPNSQMRNAEMRKCRNAQLSIWH